MENKEQELIYLPEHDRKVEKSVLIAKIATYLFVTTSHETSTGNWCTSTEEVAEDLAIPEEFVKANMHEIVDELWQDYGDDLIAEIEIEDDPDGDLLYFDITLWHCAICGFIDDDACYEEEAE